ncbi:hypothetical protein BDW62DRAFT_207001 [Aspergillus aurantiobrunneus]
MALLVLFFNLLAVLALAAGKPLISRQVQEVSQGSFAVTLQPLGNTTVEARITYLGTEGIRLVWRGGILDHVPTKKVTILDDPEPEFTGTQISYILSDLTDDAFIRVSFNQTVSSVFDIAEFYALSAGEYTAIANGTLEYTTLTDHKDFHASNYESNVISFTAPSSANRLSSRSILAAQTLTTTN